MSIKHTTTVDIGDLRTLSKPIHLMQYDKSLPEIEVHITKDGQEYTILVDTVQRFVGGNQTNTDAQQQERSVVQPLHSKLRSRWLALQE